MSQWDYKIDQPMPGPFPFPNSRKGPGIEVAIDSNLFFATLYYIFPAKSYIVIKLFERMEEILPNDTEKELIRSKTRRVS